MKEYLRLGETEEAGLRHLAAQDPDLVRLDLISIRTFNDYQAFLEKNINSE